MDNLEHTVVPVVELIYNNDTDTSTIDHVMLICDSVSANQIFVDSANANTFPIVYSYYSDSSNLLQLLLTKFTHIQRISFVFHDPINQPKTFLDEKPFFTDDDLILGQTTFSDNVTFLKNLISQFTVSNIDFLACNSLLYDNWKTYYQLLTDTTTVIVGASDNLSGNIKYGADWVMENTNTDIKTIYFNDNIDDFPVFLAVTTLSQNGGTIYFQQGTNGPEYSTDDKITWNLIGNNSTNIVNSVPSINNVLTVQFTTDMSFTNVEQYFICGSQYITFDGLKDDGNRATITFTNLTNCLGLIQNGTSGANGQSSITVQNIHVASSGTTTLANNAGWVCHRSFGKGVSDVSIDNCYSEGDIVYRAGGICGRSTGTNGAVTITNCYSKGDIGGEDAGGICGAFGGQIGTVTITNSYSEGDISGRNAGGICGNGAGAFGGKATITNTYSLGEITGPNAGGICGRSAGYDGGNVTINNSYSEGGINGPNTGGICGGGAGNEGGTVTITNSYSLYASGDTTIASGGMIGLNGSATFTNTYGADGSWSDASAESVLLGYPTPQTNPGDTWAYDSSGAGFPYILKVFFISFPISNVCFPAGTPIHTNQGIIGIHLIDPKIHTIRDKKIITVTKTKTTHKYLVCFDKNALGNNVPSQQTIITNNHKIFYNGKMIKSKYLLGKYTGVKKIKYEGQVLYNILLENHDKMVVNNLICETLHPENRITQLYNLLNILPSTQQQKTIQFYNNYIIKNNIYATK